MGLHGIIPLGDHNSSFDYILDQHAYFWEDELLNCKSENQNNNTQSLSENFLEELLYLSKVKTKGVSFDENLFEALGDEDVHLPLMGTQQPKRFAIIIVETKYINFWTIIEPKVTYIATSLSTDKYHVFIIFFKNTPSILHGLTIICQALVPLW